jgi:hypothetical protein
MRVTWDDVRPYSQGVSKGMLYPENSPGVAWNGLTSVTERGDGAPSALYIDGQKYLNRSPSSFFAGTISAITYPDEFEPCIGLFSGVTGQPRPSFGFSYRNNNELHIVYNALAALSSSQFQSLGDQATPSAFSWDFTTQPVKIPGGKPAAHFVILLDYSQADAISELEALLYGDADNDPSLPDPDTIIGIFESNAILMITDNGDGTWTATGPDSVVTLLAGDGWTFLASGIPVDDTYFIVSVGQAADIDVGDHFRIFIGSTLKEDTLFQVTLKSAPFAGFVNVSFSPNAQSAVDSSDTVTQADDEFQIDWPSAVFIDEDSYHVSSL